MYSNLLSLLFTHVHLINVGLVFSLLVIVQIYFETNETNYETRHGTLLD